MQPKLEAIFVAADSPSVAAGLLGSALGAAAAESADDTRQQVISGLGMYLVIEPSSADKPQGTVTIWLRTSDARASHARLVASGCESVEAPQDVGGEVVATVRTPQGLNLGLISGGRA